MQLDGKVAIVTGGGTSIGKAISKAFARAGATAVLAARRIEPLEATKAEIEADGGKAVTQVLDITNEESVKNGVAEILEKTGRIDALVNNAGIGGPAAPMWEQTLEGWEETMLVNTTGAFLMTREVLPHMIERGSGNVTMIGSMTGKRPLVNRTPYSASKIAIVGMVRTLAWEVGPYGITVNTVSPGPVYNERQEWVLKGMAEKDGITVEQAADNLLSNSPLKHWVNDDHIGQMCVFLASDAGKSITGDDINVAVGMVMY